MKLSRIARIFLLGTAGFLAGSFAIAMYTRDAVADVLGHMLRAQPPLVAANSCDQVASEDEIFFLSCGGIY